MKEEEIDWNAPMIIRSFRNSHWFWLDNIVIDNYLPKIGGPAFALYAYLCRFVANDSQKCKPMIASMAEDLQCSQSTVYRNLQILEENGMLSIERGKRIGGRKGKTSNQYALLDLRPETSVGGSLTSSSKQTKSILETSIETSAETSVGVREQDYNNTKNKPKTLATQDQSPEESLVLTSDDCPKKKSKAADERYPAFFEKLKKFYKYINGGKELYWTAADSKQLCDFLKHWPLLKLEDFHFALENYMNSENIIQSRTPKQFLPSLNLYFDSALDKYNKPIADDKRTVH